MWHKRLLNRDFCRCSLGRSDSKQRPQVHCGQISFWLPANRMGMLHLGGCGGQYHVLHSQFPHWKIELPMKSLCFKICALQESESFQLLESVDTVYIYQ
jgi:hypothetical protein